MSSTKKFKNSWAIIAIAKNGESMFMDWSQDLVDFDIIYCYNPEDDGFDVSKLDMGVYKMKNLTIRRSTDPETGIVDDIKVFGDFEKLY